MDRTSQPLSHLTTLFDLFIDEPEAVREIFEQLIKLIAHGRQTPLTRSWVRDWTMHITNRELREALTEYARVGSGDLLNAFGQDLGGVDASLLDRPLHNAPDRALTMAQEWLLGCAVHPEAINGPRLKGRLQRYIFKQPQLRDPVPLPDHIEPITSPRQYAEMPEMYRALLVICPRRPHSFCLEDALHVLREFMRIGCYCADAVMKYGIDPDGPNGKPFLSDTAREFALAAIKDQFAADIQNPLSDTPIGIREVLAAIDIVAAADRFLPDESSTGVLAPLGYIKAEAGFLMCKAVMTAFYLFTSKYLWAYGRIQGVSEGLGLDLERQRPELPRNFHPFFLQNQHCKLVDLSSEELRRPAYSIPMAVRRWVGFASERWECLQLGIALREQMDATMRGVEHIQPSNPGYQHAMDEISLTIGMLRVRQSAQERNLARIETGLQQELLRMDDSEVSQGVALIKREFHATVPAFEGEEDALLRDFMEDLQNSPRARAIVSINTSHWAHLFLGQLPLPETISEESDEDLEDVTLEATGPRLNPLDYAAPFDEVSADENCPVCLYNFVDENNRSCMCLKGCRHLIHLHCLDELINASYPGLDNVPCPCCRGPICRRRPTQPVHNAASVLEFSHLMVGLI